MSARTLEHKIILFDICQLGLYSRVCALVPLLDAGDETSGNERIHVLETLSVI